MQPEQQGRRQQWGWGMAMRNRSYTASLAYLATARVPWMAPPLLEVRAAVRQRAAEAVSRRPLRRS